MEFAVLGDPDDEITLRLDHREFGYAGKFVMSNTGKAVVRESAPEDGERRIVAAIAFNEDRTDPDAAWLRYVTVRNDRRGDGIGARLAGFTTDYLHDAGYDEVKIAVNNPFAYHALHKAGFGPTGEATGIAELVLSTAVERTTERYQSGLDAFRERENLAAEEREFLDAKAGEGPPDVVPVPE